MAQQQYKACILALDGVLLRTAPVHAAAWQTAFDEYLTRREAASGAPREGFDLERDYRPYLDGSPGCEGAAQYLDARGLALPRGAPDDPAGRDTVWGLVNRKTELFERLLESRGVTPYEDTVSFVRQLRAGGTPVAAVCSTADPRLLLQIAGIGDLIETWVDGRPAQTAGANGETLPDPVVEAARRLDVPPAAAVVIETAPPRVAAARRDGAGLVVGIARQGGTDALREAGADLVVGSLASLDPSALPQREPPDALEHVDTLLDRLDGRHLALFLDYDGTLTPIVRRPEEAVLSAAMRATLTQLSRSATLAVVSGRDLMDVRERVGMEGIYYAGSHGFDIAGPGGQSMENPRGVDFLPLLDQAERDLRRTLSAVDGAQVERKRFSVAVHYRRVAASEADAVEQAVDRVVTAEPRLRKTGGKKVFEVQPALDWDKGRAVEWLLEALGLPEQRVLAVYVGDDLTDEDAFRALRVRGLGIQVADTPQATLAHYRVRDVEAVRRLLEALAARLRDAAM